MAKHFQAKHESILEQVQIQKSIAAAESKRRRRDSSSATSSTIAMGESEDKEPFEQPANPSLAGSPNTSQPVAVSKKGMSKTRILRKYVIVNKTDKTYVCIACKQSRPRSLTGGWSNVVKHFRMKHESILDPSIATKRRRRRSSEPFTSNTMNVESLGECEVDTEQIAYPVSPTLVGYTNALQFFIAKGGHPDDIVKRPEFIKLCSTLQSQFQLPFSNTVRSW